MKKITFVALLCVSLLWVQAQNDEIPAILNQIKQNNKALQSYNKQIENELLQYKLQNALKGIDAGAYYMPFGNNNTGVYTEFEVTQSFQFPTVYSARKDLIEKQETQLNTNLFSKEQSILLEAKQYLLELVYLNKCTKVESERVQKAQEVYNQINALFEAEEIGILELNKAKVNWLQEEFKLQQTGQKKEVLLKQIQVLNGGNAIVFNQSDYYDAIQLQNLDSLWLNKKQFDPILTQLAKQSEVAQQQIIVSKNEVLPDITVGFNYQGVAGSNYAGFFGGLSLPLWNAKRKIEVAESQFELQQSFADIQLTAIQTNFEKQYQEYELLLNKFIEYKNTLNNLNSDALLLQAYQLDELSFLDYYMELKFYHNAIDAMLEMEKELYTLKAQLLKHQL